MEFTKSSRGKDQLMLDGYLFNKQKVLADNVISWECVDRRNSKSCIARVKTRNDQMVGRMNDHTHPPCPEKIQARVVRSNMKDRARTTTEKTRNIMAEEVSNEPDDVLAMLPSARTLQRDIQRQRQKHNIRDAIPDDNDFQFEIPNRYTLSTTGEQFLQIDSQMGGRCLIFGTDASINFLRDSPDWFMDGTFETVPRQFMQLYTIHGLQNGRNAIGLYALLRNKDQRTYEHMFNHVSALTNGVVPQSINVDFEQAAINAADVVYPDSDKRGCFFHLSQNVYKCVKRNGLTQLYLDDQEFRTNIRMISALAFIPRPDVIRQFNNLSQHCGPQEVPILDYFETNYVGELRRNNRRQPLFSHSLWNVYDRVIANQPRTTNALEGWHNAFATSLGQAHANIWTFIDALKKEHALVHMSITQHQAGLPPPVRKRKYVDADDRIRNIVADYAHREPIEFLRALSYNIAQ